MQTAPRVSDTLFNMATIYDIASEAGVSASTVSRALKGSRLVSDDVRERVEKVARELGFERRTVRRHRGRAILSVRLVLPHHDNPERALFYDLEQLIVGLREGLAPSSCNLICDTASENYDPFPHKKGGDTDAFVFAFHEPAAEILAALKKRSIPVVLLNRTMPGVPCVTSDYASGMGDLVEHVIAGSNGKPVKPVFIGIESNNVVFRERLEGWTKALSAHGLAPDHEKQVVYFENFRSIDTPSIRKLVESFNALFCVNDLVATAVLAELGRAGISVPEQVQVTGFDDSPVRGLTRPLLTTVKMPVHEFAFQAGRELANRIIESTPMPPCIRITGLLLPGQSTFPTP